MKRILIGSLFGAAFIAIMFLVLTVKMPHLNKNSSAPPAPVQKSASKIKLEEFEKIMN